MTKVATTFRSLLAEELLSLCKKTTAKQRGPETKRKFSKAKVERVRDALGNIWGKGDETHRKLMAVFAELLDAPELAVTVQVNDLFSVVLLGKKGSNHGYTINKPYIVTHAGNRYLLHEGGGVSDWSFGQNDDVTLATDEQVEECIASLTDAQWKTITSNPIFSPITQAILDKTVLVEDDTPEDDLTPEALLAKAK